MRYNLPDDILYAGICYASPASKLGQMYIPFTRVVNDTDLEAIARDFVPFAMQKTGDVHHSCKRDQRIFPKGYDIVGPLEKRSGEVVNVNKYTIGSGFLGVKESRELVSTIMIIVYDLAELSPRGGPMLMRENMSKVLEKYVKELRN